MLLSVQDLAKFSFGFKRYVIVLNELYYSCESDLLQIFWVHFFCIGPKQQQVKGTSHKKVKGFHNLRETLKNPP